MAELCLEDVTPAPAIGAAGPRVLFFVHNVAESTVRKRVLAFRQHGAEVATAGFRRLTTDPDFEPDWPHTEFGVTRDRAFVRRATQLATAVASLFFKRREIAEAEAIYARNLDMALLAVAASGLSGRRAPFVYEVLDVHRMLASDKPLSFIGRAVERLVLKRADLLVVSSPAFVDRYFTARQKWLGRTVLLENKVRDTPLRPPRPIRRPTPPGARPKWTIGWFGALRDQTSLELLTRLADRLGDQVEIYIRGYLAGVSPEAFEAAQRRPNVVFGGPYRNPEDLAEIYGRVHFAWAVDLFDGGLNSDWLLSNRLYEGGLYGVPALGAAGTEVSRKVADLGLGWSFPAPYDEAVAAFLATLHADVWAAKARHILSLPESAFVDLGDTRALVQTVRELARPREIRFGAAEVLS
ncbi:glycosyltransferase family 4 protein [Caulobacter sp. 17J65-9]|uniref:glycosyltransferase family 4 protein n=1 Tax=Caulobacter sp. 17J65-9 TaxID=2709382 RepID=UPI0013C7A19F|nr:glycosyltransferase family 4 protein [Caulobacter sp. 17J65-9]NEX93844.1 glycosyltransferase family 4 protein [Caulobacter sp. 17J65-9]